MKLLLDEMFDPAIARQLRRRGFDVVAVVESEILCGLSDIGLFDIAQLESRTLVTEDASDFVEIHKRFMLLRQDHYGVILTNDRRFPRMGRGTGKIVRALSRLLEGKEEVWYSSSFLHWLR